MWIDVLEILMDGREEKFKEIVERAKGDRSQSEFARELGVSASAVQKWLTGNGFPSSDNLEKIAKAAGLSGIDALRNFLKGEAPVENEVISAEEMFLLTKKMGKEERKRLINLILEDL